MHERWLFPAVLLLGGCVGSTGGDTFSFDAYAMGPAAADGTTYSFSGGRNRAYAVTLTRARVHIGAIYLNRSVQTSVGASTSCTLNGIYVAEVTAGLNVDALSPNLQAFPIAGNATTERAHTGELWLMGGGDINARSDSTVILDVVGTAEKDGTPYPFEGKLTISSNRAVPPQESELPGSNPICKERRVSPIDVDIVLERGGRLVLRIDPAGMFTNVEFSALRARSDGIFAFDDRRERDQASNALYDGLHASSGVYELAWEP